MRAWRSIYTCTTGMFSRTFSISTRFSPMIFDPHANSVLLRAHLSLYSSTPTSTSLYSDINRLYAQNSLLVEPCVYAVLKQINPWPNIRWRKYRILIYAQRIQKSPEMVFWLVNMHCFWYTRAQIDAPARLEAYYARNYGLHTNMSEYFMLLKVVKIYAPSKVFIYFSWNLQGEITPANLYKSTYKIYASTGGSICTTNKE